MQVTLLCLRLLGKLLKQSENIQPWILPVFEKNSVCRKILTFLLTNTICITQQFHFSLDRLE